MINEEWGLEEHMRNVCAFFQYAGYLFVGVGHQEECHLQRIISMTIRMVQLVVGPCVTM